MERLHGILEKRFGGTGMTVTQLAGHVKALSDLFRDPVTAGRYMEKDEFRLAYLFYFYPLNVFKYQVLFDFYREQFAAARIFFDYGCGPLTCHTALALAGLPHERLFAWDRSRKVFEEGLSILRQLAPETAGRVSFGQPGIPADFVSAGNIFAELESDVQQQEIQALAGCVGEAGSLLIMEPGTRNGFAGVQSLKAGLVGSGFRLLSACPSPECPMTGRDWCHENVIFPRSALMKQIEEITGLDNRFVNFSYLLMGRSAAPAFPAGVLKVVSNLLDRKGEYILFICGQDGVRRFRLLKRNLSTANADFIALRRGDLVSVECLSVRPQFSEVEKGTAVKLVRKFGRG